jgi:hypothetical protein
LLNKSCNKLHGLLNDYGISVATYNYQSSSEFQAQIQPQRPGRFSNASQRVPIDSWVKKMQTLNIPKSMVKLLIMLWLVYQYTQSLQRYKRPS